MNDKKGFIYHSRGILVILDVQGYIGNFESVGGIRVILGIRGYFGNFESQ